MATPTSPEESISTRRRKCKSEVVGEQEKLQGERKEPIAKMEELRREDCM